MLNIFTEAILMSVHTVLEEAIEAIKLFSEAILVSSHNVYEETIETLKLFTKGYSNECI